MRTQKVLGGYCIVHSETLVVEEEAVGMRQAVLQVIGVIGGSGLVGRSGR